MSLGLLQLENRHLLARSLHILSPILVVGREFANPRPKIETQLSNLGPHAPYT